MITLAKVVGGSHMYGLNTPDSDYDERYVFMHDTLGPTIGLERFEHLDERGGAEDKFGFELRHYLNLMRKTNSQVIEIVFAEKYIELHPLFDELIIKNRHRLLDTERMFKSLMGYMHGERRLANGERVGVLGGKRKAQLDKYGFSPKNFVQLFRLAWCGVHFIRNQVFPTNIAVHDQEFAARLMDIKLHPENHTKENLNDCVDGLEHTLKETFDNRDKSKDLKFDEKLANEVLLQFYFPVLAKHYGDLRLTQTNN